MIKFYNKLIFIILIVFIACFVSSRTLWALELTLEESLSLTQSGARELTPKINTFDLAGQKAAFIVLKNLYGPVLMRKFLVETGTQGKGIILFPKDNIDSSLVGDFNSLFVNGFFYLLVQTGEVDEENIDQTKWKFPKESRFSKKDKMLVAKHASRKGKRDKANIINLLLIKYDQEFKIDKVVSVMRELRSDKKKLIDGGMGAERLVIEQADNPGLIAGGEKIHVISEIRRRDNFTNNQAQYRLHSYSLDLDPISVKDISTGKFDGGFEKLISPIFHDGKFWLLGEFVPGGYTDPDLPKRLVDDRPRRRNKDLFITQYDLNWNRIGPGWQLTKTFPAIEYYATGLVAYKDHFFIAYSYADDFKDKESQNLGDGKIYLAVFDQSFSLIKKIKISDGIASHASIAAFNDYLLLAYVEKSDIRIRSVEDFVNRERTPKEAGVILKIFKISD